MLEGDWDGERRQKKDSFGHSFKKLHLNFKQYVKNKQETKNNKNPQP